MKKFERPKASKREDGIDFISNMPDAILLLILSMLNSTEEVIRTSILSIRWRYLWTSIPSLDIYCLRPRVCPVYFPESEFKEFVDGVLANRSVDMDSFRLCCSNYCSMSTVGRWIHAAVTRNVKQLDLWFHPKEETEYIELPHCLVTCGSLKVLRLDLDNRGLRLPNFIGFPALRVLHLTCVNLLKDDALVNDFLQSCPLLEDLALLDCLLYKLDQICILSSKLKKLSIVHMEFEDVYNGIKISCPKLVYLNLRGYIALHFFIECIDSLKEAVIEPKFEVNTKSVLFPAISHLEFLSIHLYLFFESLSKCIDAALDPSLPNLKTLGLTTSIDSFTMDKLNRILKYCPKLESLKLTITEEFVGAKEWGYDEGDPTELLTNDVKKLEFFEFNGEKPEVDIDWDEVTLLKMVCSWGNKTNYSS